MYSNRYPRFISLLFTQIVTQFFSLSLPNPLFQFFLRSTINEILQGRIIIPWNPTLPQPLRIFTFESLSVNRSPNFRKVYFHLLLTDNEAR